MLAPITREAQKGGHDSPVWCISFDTSPLPESPKSKRKRYENVLNDMCLEFFGPPLELIEHEANKEEASKNLVEEILVSKEKEEKILVKIPWTSLKPKGFPATRRYRFRLTKEKRITI